MRQTALEGTHHARALFRIIDLRIGRIDVERQITFTHHPMGAVFIGGQNELLLDADLLGDPIRQGRRLIDGGATPIVHRRNQARIAPQRLAVLAPIERESPARQALARIPFALTIVQKAAGREAFAQTADQFIGQRALGRTNGGGVPFRRFEIVDRHEGRLAAHGEAHVLREDITIDRFSQFVERLPGLA